MALNVTERPATTINYEPHFATNDDLKQLYDGRIIRVRYDRNKEMAYARVRVNKVGERQRFIYDLIGTLKKNNQSLGTGTEIQFLNPKQEQSIKSQLQRRRF